MIEIPKGLMVHMMKYSYARLSAKVRTSLAIDKEMKPITKDVFTPNLSIKYPEIVKP